MNIPYIMENYLRSIKILQKLDKKYFSIQIFVNFCTDFYKLLYRFLQIIVQIFTNYSSIFLILNFIEKIFLIKSIFN